jgi:hypothetical protein
MNFNYKKNKLEQLKGFCATVEAGGSVNNAAIKCCISATTISKQISSFEEDLGFLLFDRIKNKLVLNEKGDEYYNKSKKILLDLNELYGGKLGIEYVSRYEIFFNQLKNKIKYSIFTLNLKLRKMIVKITYKQKNGQSTAERGDEEWVL